MRIKAFADADEAFVAWRPDGPIDGCRGFAVYRRKPGKSPEIVPAFVGFEGSVADDDGPRFQPSTVWPVQKYSWIDFLAQPGDRLKYRVVPMVGPKGSLTPLIAEASEWSNEVHLSGGEGSIQVHFNRGIVASQWLSRRLDRVPAKQIRKKLASIIETKGNKVRNLLAGDAREALLSIVAEASRLANGSLHAALFELNDPELIEALCGLGPRAHVVLANGAAKHRGEDENAAGRAKLLAAHVDLTDRMTAPSHLAHNKFAVVSDGANRLAVLTGSTNWTVTGLCTQANNAIVVRDRTVAEWYFAYWERLHVLKSAFPKAPRLENNKPRTTKVGSANVSVWFTAVDKDVDLDAARARIAAAKHGIMFLMFNPGPMNTLLTAILDRGAPGTATYDPDLYVHGVVNQEPGTAIHPVTLYHRGEAQHLGADVIIPAAIESKFSFWEEELRSYKIAMVHSKVVIVDPFGEHPVVMTGSHNMGPKASGKNDDNLIVIEGDHALAEAYAVNLAGVYNQYRWRQRVLQGTRWKGLWDNDHWQHDYFEKPEFIIEAAFWLGAK
jgi:phosphatidylserine/phosphatidylglycerophosphate/cardiolipin synthase-like enzyme